MTSLDTPLDGMTSAHAPENGVLTLHLDNFEELMKRAPQIGVALVECAAFVNWRRIEENALPVLALSYDYNSDR